MSIGDCDAGSTQWSYPIPPGLAQEAAPLILCGVVTYFAEADCNAIGIPLRIGRGGSDGVEARQLLQCPRSKVWKVKIVLFHSVELKYMGLGTDQISTLYIKRQESQRDT